MKSAMIVVSILLALMTVAIGIAAGGAGAAGAGDRTGSGLATSDVVFSEDFEGAFPGSKWLVGDMDSSSGADYWGAAWTAEAARVHQGNWSGWCAEEGTNSPNMDVPNFSIRAYDYNMDAFMHLAWDYSVDLSAADLAYLDFWAWSQTEPNADYLGLEWYEEGSGSWVNVGPSQRITGSTSWTQHYWTTPYSYMTSGALFGFLFHSDFSEIGEGVYVDDVNLMQADVTVESDSYADAAHARPGDTFTLHYRILNPAPFPVQCGMSARIAGIDAPVGYADAAHDTVVTIPSGYSWQTRTFTVPAGVPPEFGAPDGLYNIIFEIWSGTPHDTTGGNRFWGYSESTDTLRVDTVAPSAPTLISPANGARISDNTPSFDWSDVTDPSGVYYFIQVDNDTDLSSPVIGTPALGLEVPSSQYTAPSALADGRYYWRVAAEDRLGNSSSPSAVWHFDVDTRPPIAVTTSAATLIEPTGATLNGNLTALGSATSDNVSFEWGLTTAYGSTTTPEAMTDTGAFIFPLSGLTPATAYHFRAKAVGDDTAYGGDLTFTTGAAPATPPAVATADADSVTAGSARLNGDLTSLGTAGSVTVSFLWGTAQGGPYANETVGVAQTATGTFRSELTGLASGTTLYYKARAVGNGTSYGSERSFTTAATAGATAATAGAAPVIASLVADNGRPGEELTVIITGANLTGATAVGFDSGITINDFRVVGDTEITVRIAIASGADAGPRDVTVATPYGTGTAPGAFSVNEVGSKVHLWVYLASVAGGLAGLGIVGTLAIWLRRRSARADTMPLSAGNQQHR